MEKSNSSSALKETPSSLRAKKFITTTDIKPIALKRTSSMNFSNSYFDALCSPKSQYTSNLSTANQSVRDSDDPKTINQPRHIPHRSLDFSIPSPKIPLIQSAATKPSFEHLNRFELNELQKYKKIYFIRKTFANYTDDTFKKEGEYFVVIGDAICFRYEIREIIGSGNFGQVLKCIDHKNKQQVAIKVLSNHNNSKKLGLNEYRIVELLNRGEENKNIVKVMKRFVFRHHFFMVFELLGVDLYSFLSSNGFNPVSLNLTKRFAAQILKGVEHMHENSIIHCDLKPENIMLKQGNKSSIRIIDFGTACMENKVIFTYFQTRFYRAPEVVLRIGNYGPEIDIWSLGCIVCELLLGVPLFSGDNNKELLISISEHLGAPPKEMLVKSNSDYDICVLKWKKKPILRKRLKGYTEEVVDFVESCLKWKPQDRVTASEGLRANWFQSSHSRNSSLEDLKRLR